MSVDNPVRWVLSTLSDMHLRHVRCVRCGMPYRTIDLRTAARASISLPDPPRQPMAAGQTNRRAARAAGESIRPRSGKCARRPLAPAVERATRQSLALSLTNLPAVTDNAACLAPMTHKPLTSEAAARPLARLAFAARLRTPFASQTCIDCRTCIAMTRLPRIVRPGSAGRAARRREASGSRRHRVGDLVRETDLAPIRDRGGWEPPRRRHGAVRVVWQTAGPVFIL